MPTYIDVRGVWPILFVGFRAYVMRDCKRSITVGEAMKILAHLI